MSKAYMRTPSGEVFQTSHPEYHSDCENLGNGAKGYAARREYVCKELRKILKPGRVVYTDVNSISSSGMSREISVYIADGKHIRNITHLVSDATAHAEGKKGIRMQGCGMDMGFALVYALGQNLWPKGTRKPHGTRNGAPDSHGGYALKHEWL